MRKLDFDDLWKNHLFDYKDGDLLVIDDVTRLQLADYENTSLSFVMGVFCMEGRMQCVVDGQEYRLGSGDFFIYYPGMMIGEILLSAKANVKVIAFAQRAIDRSLYLNKYVWDNLAYIKEHPLFTLSERERQGISHYYQLMMIKKEGGEGSFQHDVVRLLFQALMLEFLMLVERRRGMFATDNRKWTRKIQAYVSPPLSTAVSCVCCPSRRDVCAACLPLPTCCMSPPNTCPNV